MTDIKTYGFIGLLIIAGAITYSQYTKRMAAKEARIEAIADRNEAVRAHLAARQVALAWKRSSEECQNQLDMVLRIAKETDAAHKKRLAKLQVEIGAIKPVTKSGDYTLKDVVRDAQKWQ